MEENIDNLNDYYDSPRPLLKKTQSTPVKLPFKKTTPLTSLSPLSVLSSVPVSPVPVSPVPVSHVPVHISPAIQSTLNPTSILNSTAIIPPSDSKPKSPKSQIVHKSNDTITMIKSKIPKYSLMPREEQALYRSTFKAKFLILRDAWKNYNIPELNENMTLEEIHECYEIYVKNIRVNESSGKYKVYLVIIWLFIEYLCCRIGLNISGYTMSQMKSINKYETLLIKLGEKNYRYTASDAEPYPVEFDILFMALINAVTFIIIKMLCESINMNENLANTIIESISTILSGSNPQPGNVLFGTPHTGISDVPQNNTPMGNLDLPNLLANLGGLFMNKQNGGNNQKTNMEQPAKTPRFRPAYDD
ncbi:MAG TPA: hypothetical protein VLG50_02195 [Candidatus Saccharimonadales bacterium]|nr:hypothetical protein [Candidatus Saccharimonadales bacterium]